MKMEKRLEPRRKAECAVKVNLGEEIIDSDTLDISNHGAKLLLRHPIQLLLRVQMGTKELRQLAKLAWVRPNADGEMECGLEYVSESEPESLEDYGPMRLLWV